jgi:hypothetical protein
MPVGTKGRNQALDGLNIMLPNPKTPVKYYSVNMQSRLMCVDKKSKVTPDTEEAFAEYIMKEFKRHRGCLVYE